ncbi:MAG: division/cell wall cluster transcriptional repressor MraZ [Coriobacteriia bacterium]|nr:division/cell wall cluster transcriptional repressor MraZ [Coriobacteriia bacterium]
MVDLFGEYRHKVDAKGRLALPAKFRKVLSEDLIVIIDPLKHECLYVFESEDYGSWVKSFFNSEEPFNNRSTDEVELRRRLRSAASDVALDTAGRINVPANQREKVGIDKDVVILGNEGYFEIWDAKRWDDHCEAYYRNGLAQ